MMIKRPAPVRWQRRPAKRADACTVIYQSRRGEKGGRVKLVSKLDSKKHWLPVVLEQFQEQCCGEITLKLLCFFCSGIIGRRRPLRMGRKNSGKIQNDRFRHFTHWFIFTCTIFPINVCFCRLFFSPQNWQTGKFIKCANTFKTQSIILFWSESPFMEKLWVW